MLSGTCLPTGGACSGFTGTYCSGGTVSFPYWCTTVDGNPITQSDVGKVITSNLVLNPVTIDSLIPTTGPNPGPMAWQTTTCPTTVTSM